MTHMIRFGLRSTTQMARTWTGRLFSVPYVVRMLMVTEGWLSRLGRSMDLIFHRPFRIGRAVRHARTRRMRRLLDAIGSSRG